MAFHRMPNFPPRRIGKFWSNIVRKAGDECWQWTGSTDSKGYGKFYMKNGDKELYLIATRVVYFLVTSQDPEDLCILHSCDNPRCCNPAHLRLGTHQDNVVDMLDKERNKRGANDANAKLSDIDVYFMREMWISRLFTQRVIASKYEVSGSVVCHIVNGSRWKHVPMPPGIPPAHGWKWGKKR